LPASISCSSSTRRYSCSIVVSAPSASAAIGCRSIWIEQATWNSECRSDQRAGIHCS